MENCIFCKIVAGEIPSHKIYEDENVLAFLDITPVNPGHVLVVPKEHHENFLAWPAEKTELAIQAIKKIAPAVMAGVSAEGFNLNLNNGAAAGQVVNHVHWHIVPRFGGDGRELWRGKEYGEGEAEHIVKMIITKL